MITNIIYDDQYNIKAYLSIYNDNLNILSNIRKSIKY